ncbi:MAG: UDP-4-amino-4,6-dideoxy-N-acetyl-beta-L-altrosamine transaminase, partial [Acidobacteria bacterium RBG_16_64_8]
MQGPSFIPFARPDLDDSELEAVSAVLRTGWITTGPRVAEFEEAFRSYVGCANALAVNSCTAAMHLALEAMGVGEGDEVITSPYTFASTAAVVEHLRARPVLVDVEPDTLNIDPGLTAGAITSRTKVLLPVHFAGHPADMEVIYELASKRGLAVLEDCAHAFPARYRDRTIGCDVDRSRFGGISAHASCFSFYATKTLTTGEGGMLCTDSIEIAERARLMSLHGMTRDAWKRYTEAGSWYYEVVAPGFKYNMPDIAAAIGLAQMVKTGEMWTKRRNIASAYCRAFSELPELQIPTERVHVEHAWHIFPLRLNLDALSIDRSGFIEALKTRGVGASVHFIPLHIHPYYAQKYGYTPEDFPVALRGYEREISLPIYSGMTADEVDR